MSDAKGEEGAVRVLERPGIALGGLSTGGAIVPWRAGRREVVLHGTLCTTPALSELAAAPLDTLAARVYDGLYNLFVWDAAAGELLVAPDAVGARPLYYWRDGDLLAVASKLKAFRHLAAFTLQLDPQALAEVLTLRYPLGEATLLRDVKVFPRDASLVFSRDRTRVVERRTVSFRAGPSGTRSQLEALDASVADSVRTWLSGADGVSLSLSGGLDSRLLLGHLTRQGADVTATTWGNPGSDDFEYGARVAARAGVRHVVYPLDITGRTRAADLRFPAEKLESFGIGSVPFYWRGWLELLGELDQTVAHGFLGSFLGGGSIFLWGLPRRMLARSTASALPRLGDVVRVPPVLLDAATPSFRARLDAGVREALLRELGGLPGDALFQTLRYFELYYKQRRYLANGLPRLLDAFLPSALPFYTVSNLRFFLNLPLEALWGRPLLRRALSEQFPRLASVAEANTGHLSVDRSPLERLRNSVTRHPLTQRLVPSLRPQPSSSIFKTLLQRNVVTLAATFRDAHDLLGDQLDLAALAATLEADLAQRGELRYKRNSLMVLFNVCAFLNHVYGHVTGHGQDHAHGEA